MEAYHDALRRLPPPPPPVEPFPGTGNSYVALGESVTRGVQPTTSDGLVASGVSVLPPPPAEEVSMVEAEEETQPSAPADEHAGDLPVPEHASLASSEGVASGTPDPSLLSVSSSLRGDTTTSTETAADQDRACTPPNIFYDGDEPAPPPQAENRPDEPVPLSSLSGSRPFLVNMLSCVYTVAS